MTTKQIAGNNNENMRTLKIEEDGWGKIWIHEYTSNDSRILENISGHGSWEANMAAAKARLAELNAN